MIRDLHVIQTVGSIAERTGGPARSIRDLCEALGRAGARVSLIAGHDTARDDALLPPDPALALTHLVPRRRQWPSATHDLAATIARVAGDGAPTILHDNGLWNLENLVAANTARRLALPLVISPHGMLAPWALAWRWQRKRIAWTLYQRRILSRSAGLVATSAAERADVRAKVPHRPIATIPNGVAVPPLPDRSCRDAPQPRTLLFLSRLHTVKNLPGLLAGFARITADPRFDDWTLRIGGPDEDGHRAVVAADIARLGLGGRVRLEGPIAETDKAAAFAGADLFILPSFTENFGIVVAEALAHGVPALAAHGTPWASLTSEACGWHMAPDPDAIAAALTTAMSISPAERRAMGERGHALVRRDFGWDGIASQTLAYYRWLLYGGAKPEFVDA